MVIPLKVDICRFRRDLLQLSAHQVATVAPAAMPAMPSASARPAPSMSPEASQHRIRGITSTYRKESYRVNKHGLYKLYLGFYWLYMSVFCVCLAV